MKTILPATAIAGALDILSALFFGGLSGTAPLTLLQSVASGPFGEGVYALGWAGTAAGLVVHFSIMAIMASVFVWLATARPGLLSRPFLAGSAYGIILYGVMYWIVLPWRWPTVFPQTGWWNIGSALFSHIVCTGIPIALITASRRALSQERDAGRMAVASHSNEKNEPNSHNDATNAQG